MKDVGACDKLGLAGKQVFDPEISEWGNPILVMRDDQPSWGQRGELKHLSTLRKGHQLRLPQ